MKFQWGQRVKIVKASEDSDDKELTESLIGETGTITDILEDESTGVTLYNLKSSNETVEEFYWCEEELESVDG